MPFCKNCGKEVPEDAVFCPECGAKMGSSEGLVLASWGDRFIAWLIDIIILSIALSWLTLPRVYWMPRTWGMMPRMIPFANFGGNNVLHFLYWTIMEGVYGQSVGKMVMKIKVARQGGGAIDMGKSAIQSLGKAFLLPLDCILGGILYPSRDQRLFNSLSQTVVLKKYD